MWQAYRGSALQKKLFRICAFFLLLAIGWLLVLSYDFFKQPMLRVYVNSVVMVAPGDNVKMIAVRLHRQSLMRHPVYFIAMTRLLGKAKHLQVGAYEITPNMTAYDLLNHLSRGQVIKYYIQFIQGWTFSQFASMLQSNDNLKHTLNYSNTQQLMVQLNMVRSNPEGLFFPDTYQFHWGNSDKDILLRAHKKMTVILNKEWSNRAEGLPYKDPYQVLIVASMIEKEATLDSEKPMVAGVIIRRLKKRMRLQIDPTVSYGLHQSLDKALTKKDLRQDTPYNTYVHYGLPPTPIDMPGQASIHAALHPDQSQYLYYVAKGDGSHQFSTNYKDHLKAISQYIKKEKLMNKSNNKTISVLGSAQ